MVKSVEDRSCCCNLQFLIEMELGYCRQRLNTYQLASNVRVKIFDDSWALLCN